MTPKARAARNAQRLRELAPCIQGAVRHMLRSLEEQGMAPRCQDAYRTMKAQQAAFAGGSSWTPVGLHNIFAAHPRVPSALAVDVLDDASPFKPRLEFLAKLAIAANRYGLETGIAWGLGDRKKAQILKNILRCNEPELVHFLRQYGVGNDPTHVQIEGGKAIVSALHAKARLYPNGVPFAVAAEYIDADVLMQVASFGG